MTSQHRIIAIIVACALFMQSIDSTVLGTALATIADAYHVSPVRLHMAMTAYLLSLAVFMPLSGWVADRFGTRTVFRLAILIFTLASVACAFAPNLSALVAARIVQGIGGAMMVPVARLALLRAVPKSELVNAMNWVSIPALVGPLLGPPLGGLIVTYASWPWVFWINVPIGIIGIVLASIFLEDVREPNVPRIDLRGFALISIGIAGVTFVLETLGDDILSRPVEALFVVAGCAAIALYVQHARRVAAPIINLNLLRIPTFSAGIVGGSLFRVGIGGVPFLLPLMLQAGFGRSALASGLTTFAAAAGAITMKFAAQPTLRFFGFRRTLIWNALLAAFFIALCATFSPATSVPVMFAILLVGGFFRSLEFTAINSITYADVDNRRMSAATSFASMAQQLSQSIGIGLAALMLDVVSGAGIAPATSPEAFGIAFIGISVLVAASSIHFARLSPEAGNEVAHRSGPSAASPEASKAGA
ncbi:drug resistance transporter, EmrB/QacA subfamily [Faunimonas pinastri]|uniref:Drug resistance transporter, EmrB/QacA subfamily n=1 Tax=Faunimonas pinastri TaxID=1855383 RepID=A0A1H8ZZ89_9HYPH|nr:MFS transporter [Faunimonas pinastri]SEP69806.1 drug resistance transporter, EmrB/QacA subfamily [Faunimonas pinastri]